MANLARFLIDADLQRFFKEYFDDTDLNDYDVEFQSFTPEDIRGWPVDLINSCRDRPIASDSLMIVIGLPGVGTNHWYCYFAFDIGKNEGANLRHDMAE